MQPRRWSLCVFFRSQISTAVPSATDIVKHARTSHATSHRKHIFRLHDRVSRIRGRRGRAEDRTEVHGMRYALGYGRLQRECLRFAVVQLPLHCSPIQHHTKQKVTLTRSCSFLQTLSLDLQRLHLRAEAPVFSAEV